MINKTVEVVVNGKALSSYGIKSKDDKYIAKLDIDTYTEPFSDFKNLEFYILYFVMKIEKQGIDDRLNRNSIQLTVKHLDEKYVHFYNVVIEYDPETGYYKWTEEEVHDTSEYYLSLDSVSEALEDFIRNYYLKYDHLCGQLCNEYTFEEWEERCKNLTNH